MREDSPGPAGGGTAGVDGSISLSVGDLEVAAASAGGAAVVSCSRLRVHQPVSQSFESPEHVGDTYRNGNDARGEEEVLEQHGCLWMVTLTRLVVSVMNESTDAGYITVVYAVITDYLYIQVLIHLRRCALLRSEY